MTIYSTEGGLSSEKKDLIDDGVTVEVVCSEKKSLTDELHDVPLDTEYSVYNDPVIPIRRQPRPVQRRICIQLCLFVGMLTGLSISILASLYLYKTMSISEIRYRGRCGVGIIDMSKLNNTEPLKAQAQTSNQNRKFLEEDIEITESWEILSVPEGDGYNRADITHDFDQNVTAIKDLDQDSCYVMPLLPASHIPYPIDFYHHMDVLEGDEMFYYSEFSYDYVTCSFMECYDGLLVDMPRLCGDHKPLYAKPAQEVLTTTTQKPVSGNKMRNPDRKFRSYAGGSEITTYNIFN